MSFNKSTLAFNDIQGAFARALETPKGIRIPCASRGAVITLRARFNYFRKLDRAENKRTYPSDHPMWGKSAYDRLVLRVPPKGHADEMVLFIEPHSIDDLIIEEIV
jgi:hypothetical protein